MAWGAKKGIDDWLVKLEANDPSLTTLHILRFRRFGPPEVEALCRALRTNTMLRELYASGHVLTPGCVQHVSSLLAENSTLRSLCIGDASLGDEGVAALAEGLRENRGLEKLDLYGKGFGPAGASALGASLPHAPRLTHLQVSSNPLGAGGVEALLRHGGGSLQELEAVSVGCNPEAAERLADYLASQECTLRQLQLSENPELGPEGAAALASGLRRRADANAAAIADASCGSSATDGGDSDGGGGAGGADGAAGSTGGGAGWGLQQLVLSGCGIGDEGASGLADALAVPGCALTSLDVSSCGMGDAGASALGAALAQQQQQRQQQQCVDGGGTSGCGSSACLRHLVLRGNAVKAAGVEALVRGAGGLQELDLGGCEVSEGALRQLAALRALRVLSLFDTALGDDGAQLLAKLLAGSQGAAAEGPPPPPPAGLGGNEAAHGVEGVVPFGSLEELDLAGCGISEGGLRAVFSVLADGAAPALKELVVGGNPGMSGDELAVDLGQLAQRRPLLVVARATAGEQ